MGAASAVYAALQKPEKVLFHIKKSIIFRCYMFDASGERPGLGKTAYCMGRKETSKTTA